MYTVYAPEVTSVCMTSRDENDPVQSVRTTEVVFDKRFETVCFRKRSVSTMSPIPPN